MSTKYLEPWGRKREVKWVKITRKNSNKLWSKRL